jgi:hypothetical protein
MSHFVPRNTAAFNVWQGILVTAISAKHTVFGIPPEEMRKIETVQARWTAAFTAAENPATRTKGSVREKQEARKEYESGLRRLIRAYVAYNPAVTDKEREDMGLPVYGRTHTPVPVPATRPEFNIDPVDFRRLKIDFRDMGSTGKAKPCGSSGAVIACAVLDAPPVDVGDLVRSVLATRTPHILEFLESERGKTVYVALCWQNSKGQRGPWSEIESAIVP